MGKITKVILFDVTASSPDTIKEFQTHLAMVTFLSDVRIEPQTHKISHIRAFFDQDINLEHFIKDFDGVKYEDITGYDLTKMF